MRVKFAAAAPLVTAKLAEFFSERQEVISWDTDGEGTVIWGIQTPHGLRRVEMPLGEYVELAKSGTEGRMNAKALVAGGYAPDGGLIPQKPEKSHQCHTSVETPVSD